MKDVIAEQADGGALPLIPPGRVIGVFGPLVDRIELEEEPDQSRVLELAAEVEGQVVVQVEGRVGGVDDVRADQGEEGVDHVGGFGGGGVVLEPVHGAAEARGIGAGEVIGGAGFGLGSGGGGGDGEDDVAGFLKVLALELVERGGSGVGDVGEAAGIEADTVVVYQEPLLCIHRTGGKAYGVDGFQCVRHLNEIRPKGGFGYCRGIDTT